MNLIAFRIGCCMSKPYTAIIGRARVAPCTLPPRLTACRVGAKRGRCSLHDGAADLLSSPQTDVSPEL